MMLVQRNISICEGENILKLLRIHGLTLFMALAFSGMANASAEQLTEAITRQLHINQERYGLAGQAVLVTHNDEVLFRGADGHADFATSRLVRTSDIFPVYSLAKLFTSTLVMQLVERGEVRLDAPAAAYVTGLPAAWQAISVRQFLDHTSGVPEYFGDLQALSPPPFPATLTAALSALTSKPLQFGPGTATRYTQTNYLVLTALLEAHYGKPYPQIAHERIVQKLGLDHTSLGIAALPKSQMVTAYVGKDGQLQPNPDLQWPTYSYGHAALYTTLDDFARFLQAMRNGELLGQDTLSRLWLPQTLSNGQRGVFAAGWEYGESGAYHHVGHDGGTQVRVRLAFKGTLAGDAYVFIYLTTGSAQNVWSRTLVESVMATVAPQEFTAEALSGQMIDYALKPANNGDASAQAEMIRNNSAVQGAALERTINGTGYAVRESLGLDAAIRVFELNTLLFPTSANAWDSLAETYQAKGEHDKAKQLYAKAHALAAQATSGADTN